MVDAIAIIDEQIRKLLQNLRVQSAALTARTAMSMDLSTASDEDIEGGIFPSLCTATETSAPSWLEAPLFAMRIITAQVQALKLAKLAILAEQAKE